MNSSGHSWRRLARQIFIKNNGLDAAADTILYWTSNDDVEHRRMTGGADTLLARLGAINALIRLGKIEEALGEAETLSERPDAAAQAEAVLELHFRLGRLDEASAFLDRVTGGGAFSSKQRLKFGLRLATAYRAQNRDSMAIGKLMKLRHLAKDAPEFIMPLTDAAFGLQASGLMLDFIATMEQMPGFQFIRQIYLAQVEGLSRPYVARLQAEALLSSPCTDLVFWDSLAGLGARLGAPKVTVKAAKRAFQICGETAESRKRLIFALVNSGKRWSAVHHLKILLKSPEAGTANALRFAEFAIQCRRPAIAIAFLTRRHTVAPTETDVTLLLCETLRSQRENIRCRAILNEFAEQVERGARPTDAQFVRALDVSRHEGDDITQRLARLALNQFPKDPQFLDLSDSQGLFRRAPASRRARDPRPVAG